MVAISVKIMGARSKPAKRCSRWRCLACWSLVLGARGEILPRFRPPSVASGHQRDRQQYRTSPYLPPLLHQETVPTTLRLEPLKEPFHQSTLVTSRGSAPRPVAPFPSPAKRD